MTYEYTQPLDSTSSVKRITNDRLWNVRLTSARCHRPNLLHSDMKGWGLCSLLPLYACSSSLAGVYDQNLTK